MAEVQFIYNGVNTTIQCQLNEKMNRFNFHKKSKYKNLIKK